MKIKKFDHLNELINMTKVDFTGGDDGAIALYINGELYFYGDEYHDKISVKIKSFIEGVKWSGVDIEYYDYYCEDEDINYKVSEMADTPPKKLSSIIKQ